MLCDASFVRKVKKNELEESVVKEKKKKSDVLEYRRLDKSMFFGRLLYCYMKLAMYTDKFMPLHN